MKNASNKPSFWLSASRAQARDTGMALVLICLLVAWFAGRRDFTGYAILLLLLDMIWPSAYKPAAKLWFGLSHVLGAVMSKVILSVVFFVVLTPVGLIRRMLGKDPMRVRDFKKDSSSVFRARDHLFSSKDIETPY
ncbi:MAG: SxtJ family membrane protein [Thermodesulfobacteriota bacterium]